MSKLTFDFIWKDKQLLQQRRTKDKQLLQQLRTNTSKFAFDLIWTNMAVILRSLCMCV